MLNSNKESVLLSRADHSLTMISDVKEPAVLTPGKDSNRSKKERSVRRNVEGVTNQEGDVETDPGVRGSGRRCGRQRERKRANVAERDRSPRGFP